MSRLWCIAPVLVVAMLGTGLLMGDDKREPIVVNVRLPYHYNRLGLTPKQRNDIYKIRGKYAGEIQELRQKISDLIDKEKDDCEKVLTKAQKARLRELLVGSDRRKTADDEDERPAKVEKKKGAEAKDKKKTSELKGKGQPAEIKK